MLQIIFKISLFIIVFANFCKSAPSPANIDPLLAEYGHLPVRGTFYDEEYFNGSSSFYELTDSTKCKNLSRRWQKKALSIDTQGNCLNVCDSADCNGRCVRVYPNNGDLQLGLVGMYRKIVSFKSCFT